MTRSLILAPQQLDEVHEIQSGYLIVEGHERLAVCTVLPGRNSEFLIAQKDLGVILKDILFHDRGYIAFGNSSQCLAQAVDLVNLERQTLGEEKLRGYGKICNNQAKFYYPKKFIAGYVEADMNIMLQDEAHRM